MDNNEQIGCLCWMPFASGIVWKNCWAWEYYGPDQGIGWPNEINGDVICKTK